MITPPLRYETSIENIDKLNIEIQVREKIILSYMEIEEKIGSFDYIEERVRHLTSEMCEYMIARLWAIEGAKTFGDNFDMYAEVEKEFTKNYPNLKFQRPKREDI